MCGAKTICPILCHNGNTKFHRIKHHIVIIRKQTAVIRQCHKTGNVQFISFNFNLIANLQAVIICIHTVDGNLIFCLWHFSFHKAYKIHIYTIFINTHGSFFGSIHI